MSVPDQIRLASDLYRFGLTPVPLWPDGAKRPVPRWAKLKVNRPTEDRVLAWFADGPRGFSVLGGSVSRGLEALDFDNHQSCGLEFIHWADDLPKSIRARLVVIKTPMNGWRVPWFFEDDTDWDGRVLARRDRDDVSIEHHRARLLNWPGGSPLCHPTGLPYQWANGSWRSIPTLTAAERHEAVGIAKDLNVWDGPPERPKPERDFTDLDGGSDWHASDDFNLRATWEDILTPHGWTWWKGNLWSRPGRSACASATVDYSGSGMLYVFSESTPFTARKGYVKWAAFAVLNYTDAKTGITDFSAASKELARLRYGRANRLKEMEKRLTDFFPTSTYNESTIT